MNGLHDYANIRPIKSVSGYYRTNHFSSSRIETLTDKWEAGFVGGGGGVDRYAFVLSKSCFFSQSVFSRT